MKKTFLFVLILLFLLSSCGKTEVVEQVYPDLPSADTASWELQDAPVSVFDTIDLAESSLSDFETEGTTILSYKGTASDVKVPSGITKIADNAFADTTIRLLILPDTVTELGTGILVGNKTIEALKTPLLGKDKTSEQYLSYLFGGKSYSDNIGKVPASLTEIALYGTDSLPAYSLSYCKTLKTVTLCNVTIAEKFSLCGCEALQFILGTEQLVTVGESAFRNCKKLTEITFGANLSEIGLSALEGCDTLLSLTLPFVGQSRTENTYLAYLFGAENPEQSAGFYPDSLYEITLTDDCTTLGNYAFYQLNSLRKITSDAVRSIGHRAFNGCEYLKEIHLPAIRSIGMNAFMGCERLEKITLGESLEEIGINAFYGCLSITEITLPDSLTSLPASCFDACYYLETIDLGGVKTVGNNAFYRCYFLTSVTGNVTEWNNGNTIAQGLCQPN